MPGPQNLHIADMNSSLHIIKQVSFLQTSTTSFGFPMSSYEEVCLAGSHCIWAPYGTHSTFLPKSSYPANTEHFSLAITAACKHRTTVDLWLWIQAHPSKGNNIIPEGIITPQRKYRFHYLLISIYNFIWSIYEGPYKC